ncbi:VOC family protein [Psychroserpens jangbogonensis]|uniref:VOC family protein n=1 Tax=Psychroserpens jangbogonensis TaxID=1484460 RepID=UPI00053D822F|nr:VOC family protein [Psychroserpens jangbogonensis]
MNTKDNHINYIEFKANDLEKTKTFYTNAFDWTFTDYGPTYTSFADSGVFGGFEKTDNPITNGALIVLLHKNLEEIKQKIINHGCEISVDIFSFPGGKRFHFLDPSGNELAVWCEVEE